MSREFTDQPAVRKAVPLLVGIDGPSGSGKTWSALRLATGMQRVVGGDIYVVDTEASRALHYADTFTFRHVPFGPPFGSLDYLEAVRYCVKKGAGVVVVDSFSHEHIGEGGYLDTAEKEIDRLAGGDYSKRERVKMLGWAKVGPLRQKMIQGLKQFNFCLICCFRAKEKVKPVKNAQGKTEIVELGFQPLGGEDFVYEMMVNCMLYPNSGGVPTWSSEHVAERSMMKLPAQFREIFKPQKPLDEEIGEKLARWARGDDAQVVPPKSARPTEAPVSPAAPGLAGADLGAAETACIEAAENGVGALKATWQGIGKEARQALASRLPLWQERAAAADLALAEASEALDAAGFEKDGRDD